MTKKESRNKIIPQIDAQFNENGATLQYLLEQLFVIQYSKKTSCEMLD